MLNSKLLEMLLESQQPGKRKTSFADAYASANEEPKEEPMVELADLLEEGLAELTSVLNGLSGQVLALSQDVEVVRKVMEGVDIRRVDEFLALSKDIGAVRKEIEELDSIGVEAFNALSKEQELTTVNLRKVNKSLQEVHERITSVPTEIKECIAEDRFQNLENSLYEVDKRVESNEDSMRTAISRLSKRVEVLENSRKTATKKKASTKKKVAPKKEEATNE